MRRLLPLLCRCAQSQSWGCNINSRLRITVPELTRNETLLRQWRGGGWLILRSSLKNGVDVASPSACREWLHLQKHLCSSHRAFSWLNCSWASEVLLPMPVVIYRKSLTRQIENTGSGAQDRQITSLCIFFMVTNCFSMTDHVQIHTYSAISEVTQTSQICTDYLLFFLVLPCFWIQMTTK